MKYLTLIAIIFLSGCATMNKEAQLFEKIHQDCTTNHKYSDSGSCIENNLNAYMPEWKKDIHGSYVSAYIEWTKAAGAKVLNGEMTEKDAVNGSNELLARLKTQARQESEASKQSNMMMFLAGLAILNANTPQKTSAFNNRTYVMPNNKMINCTESVGFNVITCR